jgi:hypothetical protein
MADTFVRREQSDEAGGGEGAALGHQAAGAGSPAWELVVASSGAASSA